MNRLRWATSLLRRHTANGRLLVAEASIPAAQIAVVLPIVLAACLYAVTYNRGWYDDTSYHIPMAVEIARHLNPYYIDASNAPAVRHWFPAGAEAVAAGAILVTGTLQGANLTGAPTLILLLCLAFKFAGLWTPSLSGRMAAAGLVSTVPLLLGQTMTFHVDIHLTLLVCLSLYLLCRSLVTGERRHAYYALAPAVLGASVKYHGLAQLLVLAPAAAYCALKGRPAPPSRRFLVGLALALLWTSGWYVRNWALQGNPVYPYSTPAWSRPLLALSGVQYREVPPERQFLCLDMTLPHPFVPPLIARYHYRPDLGDEGFGFSFIAGFGFMLLSLAWLGRLPAPLRRAWIALLSVTLLLTAVTPCSYTVPRYIMFLPFVLALSPAVLHGALPQESLLRRATPVVVLIFSGLYTGLNIVHSPAEPTTLKATVINLIEGNRMSVARYEYVERGNLRIGYLGGDYDFIAALYDERISNTLVPLHYRDVGGHYLWEEFDNLDDFSAHVAALELDYIHIFDRDTTGAERLILDFPDKVKGEVGG